MIIEPSFRGYFRNALINHVQQFLGDLYSQFKDVLAWRYPKSLFLSKLTCIIGSLLETILILTGYVDISQPSETHRATHRPPWLRSLPETGGRWGDCWACLTKSGKGVAYPLDFRGP